MPQKTHTTQILIERELVIYRRKRSVVWQCRFKVDGKWQRATTKERDVAKARLAADRLRIRAEIRLHDNLPVITRKFRDVARLAIQRMEQELASGKGKVSYNDYIRVINEYLVPCLGKKNITNIDYSALDELDAWRIEKMGKAPTQSTILTQNAALNRVFDEGVIRNFLTEANRPKLEAKGRASKRRPAFELNEVRALLAGFNVWIERARDETSKELRTLLKDYIDVLLDTGARPGVELMNLKWKQIKESVKPQLVNTGEVDEDGDAVELVKANRAVEMVVTGKTGTRTIIGNMRTVAALKRIATRNYSVEMPVLEPLKHIVKASNNDYVIRTSSKVQPTSFQKLFQSYLEEHSLYIDPVTDQKRVFYSLRHTYATLALTNDKVPIHTLAKQMGTSVTMIEKHYSHLKVIQAIEQLRGEETRKLIEYGGEIDEMYASKATVKKNPKVQ